MTGTTLGWRPFRNAAWTVEGFLDVTRRQHRRLSRLVDAWIDGELDTLQERAVTAHVADCWHCSAAAETTLLLKRALRIRARREPPGIAAARLHRYAAALVSS